jgi:rhodanese-related sulfurtransferase
MSGDRSVKDPLFAAISARELVALAGTGAPHAVIDTREQAAFGAGHMLYASNMPLSRLELLASERIPCLAVPVVLVDADPSRTELAAGRLATMGFTDIRVLAGGVSGWQDEGYRLHIGTNVPSKLLGEHVAHSGDVKRIRPEEFRDFVAARPDLAIWDCRPQGEFEIGTLPGADNVPGTSWTSRLRTQSDNPIIVTCAGRTRGAIAVASMARFAGLENVTWLEDGLAGWTLSGRETVAPSSSVRSRGEPSRASGKLRDRIRAIALSAGVTTVEPSEVQDLCAQDACAYYFNVSTKTETAPKGAWARRVAGGQLVQTADDVIPVRNVPVVVFDDRDGEAFIAAFWLLQLGYHRVAVAEGCSDQELMAPPMAGAGPYSVNASFDLLDPIAARNLANKSGSMLVDVSSRMQFLSSHPKGALHCNRTSLGKLVDANRPAVVVITGHDLGVARLAAADLVEAGQKTALVAGGNRAWAEIPDETDAGDPTTPVEIDDYPPPDAPLPDKYERLRAYIEWELELIELSQDDPLEPPGFARDFR